MLFACDEATSLSDISPQLTANTDLQQNDAVTAILSGSVDSSLIERDAQSKVYIYPSKTDKTSKPVAVAAVEQIPGTCQWQYVFSQLAAGEYRLVLANQPLQVLQTQSLSTQSLSIQNLSIQNTPLVVNFNATHVIKVGAGRAIKSPSIAARRASSGDVIEIDTGDYPNDVAVWRQDNITIRGIVGEKKGRPHIRMTKPIAYIQGDDQANGKGIWVIKGNNIRIENIELSGAKVAHNNGAGIRIDNAINTSICNSYLHHNENGLLGGGGTLLIEYSEFAYNGSGSGYTHNIYVNQAETSLIFQYNYSHGVRVGHNLKTRAKINTILYNRIMDGPEGNSSYLVDISNGGLTTMMGNILQQSRNTVNKTTAIAYGLEGIKAGYSRKFVFINNTVVNNLASGYFIKMSTTANVSMINNLLLGGGTLANRPITQSHNLQSSLKEVIDASGYNYHLKPESKAIDAGLTVDKEERFVPVLNNKELNNKELNNKELKNRVPKYEYVHPSTMKNRIIFGDSIDIGAYEYNP